MVCFTGAGVVVFAAATNAGCDSFLALAHLALCACAIFRREAFDIKRFGADEDSDADVICVGWLVVRGAPEPFNDVSSEIA
jgi:hypothetical protein